MGVITDFLAETTIIDILRPITALDRRVLQEINSLGDFDAPTGFEGRNGYAILKVVGAIILDAPPPTGFPPGLLPKPEDRPILSPDTLKTIACSIAVTEDNSQIEADLLASMGLIELTPNQALQISPGTPEYVKDILYRWKFEDNTLEEGDATMIEENGPMVYTDGHVGARALESNEPANRLVSADFDIIPAGSFSINMWCLIGAPDGGSSNRYFIRSFETTNIARFEIKYISGQFQFFITTDIPNTKTVFAGTCCQTNGQWYLVQAYLDIVENKIAIRVRDGTSPGPDSGWQTTDSAGTRLKQVPSGLARPLVLGARDTNLVEKGVTLDEITIYDKRLPDSVFEELWNDSNGVVF